MNNKRFSSTAYIVTLAIFISFEIVLVMISNYINIGTVNINLALIPICIAAIILGPLAGFVVGIVNGLLTLISPSTIAIFMPLSPFGTVLVCLFKTALAGLISGFIYRALVKIKLKPVYAVTDTNSNVQSYVSNFKTRNLIAMIVSSLCVPIINTGLFSAGAFIFFQDFLNSGVGTSYPNTFMFLILAVIGWNFIIELGINIVVSPFIAKVALHYIKSDKISSDDTTGEKSE